MKNRDITSFCWWTEATSIQFPGMSHWMVKFLNYCLHFLFWGTLARTQPSPIPPALKTTTTFKEAIEESRLVISNILSMKRRLQNLLGFREPRTRRLAYHIGSPSVPCLFIHSLSSSPVPLCWHFAVPAKQLLGKKAPVYMRTISYHRSDSPFRSHFWCRTWEGAQSQEDQVCLTSQKRNVETNLIGRWK